MGRKFRGAGFPSNTKSTWLRPTSIPSGIFMHAAVLQPFDHNRNGPKIGEGALPPFFGRVERGSYLTQSRLARGLPPYQVASWSIQPFGCNRYGPKIGGAPPPLGRGAGSPSNTMWPGPRPTCLPSFILIRQTVWPQYTNVKDRQTDRQDRQDRQRSDSTGRTVLQTVAQKWTVQFYNVYSLYV